MLWFAPGAPLGAIVAHQGGWDEILLVAGPIVAIVVLLRIAKRRVDRSAAAMPESTEESEHDNPGTSDPSDVTDRA